MTTRRGRALTNAILAIACVLVSGTWLMAQTTTASVQGTVRDAQDAVVADAKVDLTSNTQGNTSTASTDARGNFTFPLVRPDSYKLTISKPGFKTVEMTNVIVSANDKYSAGVTTLEVSQQEETVTVVGRVPEIQATSGERSFTLESAAITNIAVNDRSVFSLVKLVPGIKSGITQGGPSADTPTTMSYFSANGVRTNSNNVTIDGVANIDTGDNGTAMATTNIDTVAEFKVLTSSYQAEYGRAAGAQLQIVTKSGGKDFSGSAYWYARRNKWNANGWKNNRDGNERDETAKRNDMGATLGGPVFIPNKFNTDRSKLFFFVSFEAQRRQDPVGASNVMVPTALERQGDFSQSLRNGELYPYVTDWQAVQAHPDWGCGPDDTRACFADGGVLGKIPENRLYAPSLAILGLYPMPNVTGEPSYNFTSQEKPDQPRNEMTARLDYHINENWRVMGRYMRNSDPNWQPLGIGWAVGGNVPMDGYRHLPAYNWMVSLNGSLNASTFIEAQLGSAHNYQEIGSDNPILQTATTPALGNFPLLFPEASTGYIPRFDFGGNTAGYFTQQAPFVNWNTTIDAIVNLTKVTGAHMFKGGLYFQQSKKPQSPFANFNGRINFSNTTSNPYDTSISYANAAIGTYNSYSQASRYAYPMYAYKNFEAYVQDNWKANRRLTLDFGVRLYYLTPQDDSETKLISNFFPDEWSASNAPRLYVPSCVGASPCSDANRIGVDPAGVADPVSGGNIGRIVPNSGDINNGSAQASTHEMFSGNALRVSPRIGFTYDLNGRQTAILRGAFGIFYDRPQGNTRFDMVGNPPGVSNPTLNYGLLSDLASAEFPLPSPNTSAPSEYDFVPPVTYAWNIGAQVKLPGAFVLDMSYVGTKGRDLLGKKQINAIPYGTFYAAENQDPTRTPAARLGDSALPANFLRPYYGYGDINMWGTYGISDYNAIQGSLTRRFDQGLMVGVTYTYSKLKGTGFGDYSTMRIDGRDKELNYGLLQADQPHTFLANVVYQLPKFAEGPMGVILNGWQISGVYTYASGYAFNVGYGFDDGTGNAAITGSEQGARVVVTGDPGSGSSDDVYRQYNTGAFGPPSPGSIGAESDQFFMHQAARNNLDLSISKSFALVGKSKLEFRLDAFNALNHMQIFSTHNTAQFAGLGDSTLTTLPYDASGNLTRKNGFGTINGTWGARTIQVVGRLTF